ncbi:sulfite exporter TauE/SafE family protein [Butyrivibrio sp. AE3006]|uniref:sulfite exporter TauE/SafE family protein n=1 Tax=Butyrivibrio sp. AE3006 TaxID=1280673 RepID=UPI0004221AE3|nr:sulfite exporter TauE/SafE family protein [Butyrivibrio sp. AE3006]
MEYVIIAVICFLASLVGSICGIGGGVIIKPVLDAAKVYSVSVISFLSGCTVLSMTAYSIAREAGKSRFKSASNEMIILAAGSIAGGVIGKSMFTVLLSDIGNDFLVGELQSLVLFVITAGTFIYTLFKVRISKKKITGLVWIFTIGAILGVISAFLGIGGGPINIVVLSYCFSMKAKEAAESSLFIILLSQLASFVTTIATGTVPKVDVVLLLMMVAMGISGGIAGRKINDLINQKSVDRLFMLLLVVIMGITLYNFRHNFILLTGYENAILSVNTK